MTARGERPKDSLTKQRQRVMIEGIEVKRSRWKRVAWIAGAIALIGIVCIAASVVLVHSYSTEVTGRLSGVRDVSFVEGSQKDGGVSPVCGCAKPPPNGWRGVTFASHEVAVSRRGGPPWTEWIVSGAEPDKMRLMGNFKILRAKAVRFRPRGEFNPRWLVNGSLPKHARIVSRGHIRLWSFGIFSRRPLNVAMLSSVPVGAWIPYPQSQVTLTADRSSFLDGTQRPRLVEKYSSHIGFHDGTAKPKEPQVYPIGDFLGPNLVLWTTGAGAVIPFTSFSTPAEPGVVTAVLIPASTFSTRIGVVPVPPFALRDIEKDSEQHPSPGLHSEHSTAPVYGGEMVKGSITLNIKKPLRQKPYEALRRRVIAHPRVTLKALAEVEEEGLSLIEPVYEEERYPPLPHFAGLNVFGPLDRVRFQGVQGALEIAGKAVPLGGSADVELGDLEGFRNGEGKELFSAPLATSREAANIEFRTAGTAAINNVPQATVSSHYEKNLAAIGFVVALLSGLVSIFSNVRGKRL